MDTVVTSMTSTEGQLKELEKQALQLQRIAEEEAQAKAAKEAKAAQAQPAQAPAEQAAPANNGGQAQKEEPKKRNQKEEPKKEAPKQEEKKPAQNVGGVIGKAQSYLGLPYVWEVHLHQTVVLTVVDSFLTSLV